MSTFETEQPCGCVVLTDDSPVTINGTDMTPLVANITGVRRCPTHQVEWTAAIQRFSDEIDRKAMEAAEGRAAWAEEHWDGAGE